MPRVSKQLAAENKINIEKKTANLIREKGLSVSVADLMHAAGLTHGGFYKHFENKDQLIDIACKDIFKTSVEKWEHKIQISADHTEAFQRIVEGYLSEKNLNHPELSCPISTLTMDIARESEDKPVKKTFNDGTEKLLTILSGLTTQSVNEINDEAIVSLSLISGALTLARSVEPDLAVRILEVVKTHLLKEQVI